MFAVVVIHLSSLIWMRISVLVIHVKLLLLLIFFFSSRRRHTRLQGDWSSDVCSSDLVVDAEQRVGDGIVLAKNRLVYHHTRVARLQDLELVARLLREIGEHVFRDQIGRASCRERV